MERSNEKTVFEELHDEYPDINGLDDLYHALDRWHDHLPRMVQLC